MSLSDLPTKQMFRRFISSHRAPEGFYMDVGVTMYLNRAWVCLSCYETHSDDSTKNVRVIFDESTNEFVVLTYHIWLNELQTDARSPTLEEAWPVALAYMEL